MEGFPPNKNGKIEKVFQLPQTKPRPRPYTHNTPNDQSIKKTLSKRTFTRNTNIPGLQ